MAKITIKGMTFHAFHGYYEEERTRGGTYIVDVKVRLKQKDSRITDSLEETVNYEDVYRITASVMKEPVNLIEHLASRLLEALRSELNQAGKITVRVRKVRPPLDGEIDETWAEVSGK